MQLVICGSAVLIIEQGVALRRLVEKHQYHYDESRTTNNAWTPTLGEYGLFCTHLEVVGPVAGLKDGNDFLAEAMELEGVYHSCPEHNKRRFWEGLKATAGHSDAGASPIRNTV